MKQEGRPITYLSKASHDKNRLSMYEKELLAILMAKGKWMH